MNQMTCFRLFWVFHLNCISYTIYQHYSCISKSFIIFIYQIGTNNDFTWLYVFFFYCMTHSDHIEHRNWTNKSKIWKNDPCCEMTQRFFNAMGSILLLKFYNFLNDHLYYFMIKHFYLYGDDNVMLPSKD